MKATVPTAGIDISESRINIIIDVFIATGVLLNDTSPMTARFDYKRFRQMAPIYILSID